MLAGIIAVALLIGLPRKYYSDAKLIVKIGRESVALDPTATTSQTLLMQKLSLIHISEPTRPLYISYAVFCLKKKK